MGADRLALRPRGPFAGATVEFGEHRLVRDGRGLNIADARAHLFLRRWFFVGADYAAAARPIQRPQIGMAGLLRKFIVKDFASGLCIWHRAGGHVPATGHGPEPKQSPQGEWGNTRMDDVRERFQNLHEFVKAARFNLSRNNYDYIVGATETETTLARNRSSLDSIAFQPR